MPRSPRYDRLTPDDCRPLHEASLSILERTGVVLHDAEAVERLHGAGARVGDDGRVRVPGLARRVGAVRGAALRHPPRPVGAPAPGARGRQRLLRPRVGLPQHHRPPHRRAARRRSCRTSRDGLTLVDALPNMDFGMSMFLPSDVPPEMADREQMAVMLRHTTKPLVVVTYDVDAMLDAIAMAEAVAGGADALRERPTIAPLHQRHPRPRPQRRLAAQAADPGRARPAGPVDPGDLGRHDGPGHDGRQPRAQQRRRARRDRPRPARARGRARS